MSSHFGRKYSTLAHPVGIYKNGAQPSASGGLFPGIEASISRLGCKIVPPFGSGSFLVIQVVQRDPRDAQRDVHPVGRESRAISSDRRSSRIRSTAAAPCDRRRAVPV